MKRQVGLTMVAAVILSGVSGAWAQCCPKHAAAAPPRPAAKTTAAEPASVDTAALAAMIGTGQKLVVLDARTGKFDDGRRLPGARSLASDTSAEKAAELIGSKDDAVVTYCSGVKCPASARLAKRLHELGYTNVIEYHEGIEGWTRAGHEVEKAK